MWAAEVHNWLGLWKLISLRAILKWGFWSALGKCSSSPDTSSPFQGAFSVFHCQIETNKEKHHQQNHTWKTAFFIGSLGWIFPVQLQQYATHSMFFLCLNSPHLSQKWNNSFQRITVTIPGRISCQIRGRLGCSNHALVEFVILKNTGRAKSKVRIWTSEEWTSSYLKT